jgi:hypothetical protein
VSRSNTTKQAERRRRVLVSELRARVGRIDPVYAPALHSLETLNLPLMEDTNKETPLVRKSVCSCVFRTVTVMGQWCSAVGAGVEHHPATCCGVAVRLPLLQSHVEGLTFWDGDTTGAPSFFGHPSPGWRRRC